MDDDFLKKIELTKIILEEYKALRAEIIAKQQGATNLLQIGFAGLGTLASVNAFSKDADFRFWSLSLIAPLFSIFTILAWDIEADIIAKIGGSTKLVM